PNLRRQDQSWNEVHIQHPTQRLQSRRTYHSPYIGDSVNRRVEGTRPFRRAAWCLQQVRIGFFDGYEYLEWKTMHDPLFRIDLGCRSNDHVGYLFRLGKHDHVAGWNGDRCSAYFLCQRSFEDG